MRFVSPETVRVALSDGHWIEVKKELTVGEEVAFRTSGWKRMGKGDAEIDWAAMSFARADAYIVDWSAKTPSGKDLKLTPEAIRSLDKTSFDEIDKAIQQHIEDQAEAKKKTSGEPS